MQYSIFLDPCTMLYSYGENLQANQMSHIVTLSKTEINPWPLPLSMSLLVLVFVCLCFYLSLSLWNLFVWAAEWDCCNFSGGSWKWSGWPLEINPWSAMITHVSPPIASWLPSTDKDHTSKLSLNIIRPNYPVSKLSPSAAKIITHLRLPRQLSHFATLPCSINICTRSKQT